MNSSSTLFTVALATLLVGCPQTPPADPIEKAPRITAFSVSSAEGDFGATVTLSWSVEDATTVKLDNLSGGLAPGQLEASAGSVDVTVDRDSLFVLTASNARGASEHRAVSVTLKTSAKEAILYALPGELTAGETATLTWSTPDAQTVSITAEPGGALDLGGQTTVGTLTLTPSRSTTYTLRADGKTATANVVVHPKITAYAASPTAAVPGAPLTISWSTVGATSITLSGVGRGELLAETDPLKVANGSFTENVPTSVDPAAAYSYLLTVRDATGATTEKLLTVYVEANPRIIRFSGPKYGRTGQSIALSWATAEADEVTITAAGAIVFRSSSRAEAQAGSVTIPTPSQLTSYVLSAKHVRGGEATKTLDVDAVGAPSVSSFTATPSTVSAGSPVTLSWTAESGRKLLITDSRGSAVWAFEGQNDNGSVAVYPNESTTYTLTADNAFGETAAKTAAVVVNSPVSLTPSLPGTLLAGTPVALSFNVPGATTITGLPHSQVDVRQTAAGFDDISSTGTKLNFPFAAFSGVQTLPVEFPVELFGQLRSVVTVSVKGYLVFGPGINEMNYSPVALPSSKIEPFAVAPFWTNHTLSPQPGAGVYWQIKSVNGERILIVQWHRTATSGVICTFQTKIHDSGQIDFEYEALPGPGSGVLAGYGVQGPTGAIGVSLPAMPTSNSGATLFGPRQSPVTVVAQRPGPISGLLSIGTGRLRVSYDFPNVIRQRELHISEVMNRPSASLDGGQWFEVSNSSNRPVDLSGWQLVQADGGTNDLSGSIPPNGALVFGQSTDPLRNGDAGVSIALPGLDLSVQGETLALKRGATMAAAVVPVPTGNGTARVVHPGPFKLELGAVVQDLTCAATATYSSAPLSLGTPGSATGCGFGYVVTPIEESFRDIAAATTARLYTSFDSAIVPLDLSSAPFPFFGTPRSTLYVSTNGFITADGNVQATDLLNSANPSSSIPNANIVVFGDNLTSDTAVDGNIHTARVAANQDPKAPGAHWIVQWTRYRVVNGLDVMNFQAKLFDDGVIELHYGDMKGGALAQSAAGPTANVWLESPSGTSALFVSNRSLTPGISPHTAFRFTPR